MRDCPSTLAVRACVCVKGTCEPPEGGGDGAGRGGAEHDAGALITFWPVGPRGGSGLGGGWPSS